MKLTVLIPTYRRAADLERCLDALKRQRRRPDQIIVVTRSDDDETRALFGRYNIKALPIELVEAQTSGQVAALNAGLEAAVGEVIAIIDDDTAPWLDWLERIERHFLRAPHLGGLGGRDMIRVEGFPGEGETELVGHVQWFGRWIGQAHRGSGPPRQVDLLKGCNMSYRREAIRSLRFDGRLRGSGAQWFNDAAFSLAVRRAGWEVVYDPAVRVDHYLGARPTGDARASATPAEVYDVVYNETLVLLEHFPPFRRAVFLGFGVMVGTRRAPGLVQWIRVGLSGRRHSAAYQVAAWKARVDAFRDFKRFHGATGRELADRADDEPQLVAL